LECTGGKGQGFLALTSSRLQGADRTPAPAPKGGHFVLHPKPCMAPYDGHTRLGRQSPICEIAYRGAVRGIHCDKGYRVTPIPPASGLIIGQIRRSP